MAKGTILVVDDEKEIRDLIDIYLKNEGYQVLKASDGRMALDLLEKEQVDLIVLDIMKNELITNFSHDLRTPLTSILGYLALIKDRKFETDEQFNDYVNIVYSKSEKLGGLIEDLFEYTKLTNKGVKFTRETVSLNELLEQLLEEHTLSFEENNLVIIKEIPQEKVFVEIDIDQTVRVFENLLLNAVKYSYKPGEIMVKILRENDDVLVIIQNKGKHIPQAELARLFDRFYRVEQSRTADKGGSGLGLAIAKGIVELQGGQIWAECSGEVIRFIVKLT
ncbi:cell wall metabolism sensor histidine kinase WalK [Desulfosporosinus sp. BICA1-9]|uniref:sensor histidine kinase n=1 Tax=Desulfosporosinus sp. BICA1-9 TaxID=1531958 RepID=UPI000A3E0219|nr:ATP-binding protein [Desulfosporosinus sp. BICA1-9]HBW38277.1 hypothetical protein [Desulfosporosinus sp.]